MGNRVRLGLIGGGQHPYRNLLSGTVAIEETDMVACADVDEVRANETMQTYGFERPYLDYSTMLAREDLDTVIVATPHHLLKEAAMASIQAGCNVFIEKPMDVTRAEAEEIQATANKVGVSAMVGYCLRYAEDGRTMKALLERGAVGEVSHVSAGKGSAPLKGWLADPKTGGGQLFFLGYTSRTRSCGCWGPRPSVSTPRSSGIGRPGRIRTRPTPSGSRTTSSPTCWSRRTSATPWTSSRSWAQPAGSGRTGRQYRADAERGAARVQTPDYHRTQEAGDPP